MLVVVCFMLKVKTLDESLFSPRHGYAKIDTSLFSLQPQAAQILK
jgi:hypothetical protein